MVVSEMFLSPFMVPTTLPARDDRSGRCPQLDAEDGRCEQEDGHEGAHTVRVGGQLYGWMDCLDCAMSKLTGSFPSHDHPTLFDLACWEDQG